DPSTPQFSALSLHDALPILDVGRAAVWVVDRFAIHRDVHHVKLVGTLRTNLPGETGDVYAFVIVQRHRFVVHDLHAHERLLALEDRKSTRLNSSHRTISYAV